MTRSFRRVFQGTAIVHVAVLALFLLIQMLLLGAKPLKLKEDIQIIDLAAGGGGDTGPEAPPEVKTPPVVKPPEDVAPPPEPPKDDNIPEPVKPKPTPKIKPKPKPAPQVKVPTPPKTNQVVKAKSNKPRLSQDQIRALLSGTVKGVGSTHTSSGRRGSGGVGFGGGGGGSDSPVAWYYAMVRQIMYEAWQQPSGLANSGNPTTTVTIRVQRDGTISTWDITRPSGNSLMDDSVRKAVQSVRRLRPLPPQFIGPSQDITIQFELEKLLM